jgi:DNA-directed RNA polymerase subunit RPC12/RpoP
VIGFVAGTAATTIYGGIAYAGLFLGPILFFALIDGAQETYRGQRVTMEATRGLSFGELCIAALITAAIYAAMLLDASARGGEWNQSFGFAQFAAIILGTGAGVIIWQEVQWQRDRTRKRCPDCAHKVLVAANKCEYCGYRF